MNKNELNGLLISRRAGENRDIVPYVNLNFINFREDGQWSDTELVITIIYIDVTRKDVMLTLRK